MKVETNQAILCRILGNVHDFFIIIAAKWCMEWRGVSGCGTDDD